MKNFKSIYNETIIKNLTEESYKPYLLIFIVIVAYIINVFFTIYLTHHIDAALYGDLSIALNSIEIASVLVIFGSDVGAKRFIPILNKNNTAQSYMSWNLKYVKKNSIVLTLVLVVGLFFLHYLKVYTLDAVHLAILFILLTPIFAVTELIKAYLNSQNLVLLSASLKSYFFAWFIFFIAFEFLHVELNIYSIVVIYAIIYTILSTFSYLIYARLNKKILLYKLMFEKIKYSLKDELEWKEFSHQLGRASLIFIVLSYIDTIIVEIVHPDEAAVGHLAVVMILAGFLLLVSRSVYQMVLPNISKLVQTNEDRNELQVLINRANRFSYSISFFLFSFYVIFGQEVLKNFHGDYANMHDVLIIFTLSQLMMVLKLGSTSLLRYAGHGKFIVYVEGRSVLFLLIFGTLFTYLFGVIGLVYVNVAVNTYMLVMYTKEAKKNYPNINTFGIK